MNKIKEDNSVIIIDSYCSYKCQWHTNSFKYFCLQTFNEFFIRELKPTARPIAYVGRDDIAICAADSRLMAFNSTKESLRLWIKV